MIATDELFKKYCEAYRISDINARLFRDDIKRSVNFQIWMTFVQLRMVNLWIFNAIRSLFTLR